MLTSPPSRPSIAALAATFTPSLEGNDTRLRRIYSNFLYVYGDLPTATRRKLSILVRLIEGISWIRYARPLSRLSTEQRTQLCTHLADAPVARLQAGFSGLRSLVLNATYTEPVMWERIGYAGPTISENE